MDVIVLSVNGERLHVQHDRQEHRLIDVLRSETKYKGPKLGCGEGGCGACAVVAESLDADTGIVTRRTINSCLAPVGLCDGVHIITAEGLGNSADGFSRVQDAVAKRFASQCGFCTPGIVVALTAAAAAAGAAGQPSSSSSGEDAGEAAAAHRAAAIAAGLDGNLCRCTGWRPIIDVCRDIADMEDLAMLLPCCKTSSRSSSSSSSDSGSCSGSCKLSGGSCGKQHQPAASCGSSAGGCGALAAPPAAASFPAWLRQHVHNRHRAQQQQESDGQQQQQQLASRVSAVTGSNGAGRQAAAWLAPASLRELAAMLAAAGAGSRRAHLVAGNTGAGVFKDLWPHPSSRPLVINLNRIRQFKEVTYSARGVVLGAGTTIQQLIHILRSPAAVAAEPAAEAAAAGGAAAAAAPASTAGVWAAMAKHLERIAGVHVRSAATIGGHFGLCAERPLQTDLGLVLAAAGAQLCLLTVAADSASLQPASSTAPPQQQQRQQLDLQWVSVEQFLADSCIGSSSGRGPDSIGEPLLTEDLIAGAKPVQQQLAGVSSSHSSSTSSWAGLCQRYRVVTALWLPYGDDARELFWSDKTALRYVNSHALVNAAMWLRFGAPTAAVAADAPAPVAEARLFVGFSPAVEPDGSAIGSGPAGAAEESWRVLRLPAVEAALHGRCVDVPVLVAALRTWEATASAAGLSGFPADAMQGLLFKALVPLLSQPPAPAPAPAAAGLLRLLQLPPQYDRQQLLQGRQVLPSGEAQAEVSGVAPVHLPVEKEGVRLQASGEATFAADAASAASGRLAYLAGVLSSEALAAVDAIDAAAALELPGVLGVLTAADIPGSNEVFDSPLLADGKVEWVGQPVALVVATSQAAAEVAAKRVVVRYSPLPGCSPIITLDQAIEAGSFYSDLPLLSAAAVRPAASPSTNKATVRYDDEAAGLVSQVDALIDAAPHSIKGATYSLPAQQHLYMEPQTAFAEPQEDGAVRVVSATQSLDAVQLAVAGVLGVPFNKVAVVAKRLGGGFGGKASRSMPVAAAAALAARRFGRPVLFALNRNADFALNPGRCAGRVSYDVGFEPSGKVVAIKAQVVYRAGARLDLSANDAAQLVSASDSAYDLTGLAVEVKLARCNLPPHTIVRGPGYLEGVMVLEQVLEHVAAVLGKGAAEVKAANFLPATNHGGSSSSSSETDSDSSSSSSSGTDSSGNSWLLASADGSCVPAEDGAAPDAAADDVRPRPCSGIRALKSQQQQQQQQQQQEQEQQHSSVGGVRTLLGRRISRECYTLPRVWDELLQLSSYHARLAAVQRYNRDNAWSKRGIAITPVRFDCSPAAVPASISVYADGSMLVTHGGIEMGQGLTTKVKQAAVAALSSLLPEEQRPLPLSLVRLAASSTETVPNAGPTWSSTGSEGNVHAVQLAAAKLVARMAPYVKLAGDGLSTWQATLAAISPDVAWSPAAVLLSAYGFFDGTTGSGSDQQPVAYSAFGAAVSEVELDLLTGERRVLASHIHYDCGFSLNPAIDLGQVEGAFVMGLGAMLCEEVIVDDDSGRLLTDSTWTYKIPTPDLAPQKFVVSFLEDAPNPRGILSSKASGEPALMTSVSALMALQQAAAAALEEVSRTTADGGSGGGGLRVVLTAPATPAKLKAAIGSFSIADRLEQELMQA